jgi:hypothetical protein
MQLIHIISACNSEAVVKEGAMEKERIKMKINRISTWIRFLIFSNILTLSSCADKTDMNDNESINKLVEHSETLSKENQFFWKGLYGFVAPNVYVKKNEEKNSLYDSRQQIYQGGDSGSVEAIHFDDTGKIRKVENEDAKSIDTGTLIVFSEIKVFVLNFDEKRFGWYEMNPRTNQ